MNLSATLLDWYSIHKRNMPWRLTKDPYKIWLSEIILQQTQVKQGLPYYKAFVKAYPTIQHLANAKEENVLKLWQGLGYYSRARNLHFTAIHIVNKFEGKFPNSYKELIKLKGIGDYTASAIASICFNEAAAVVDGNVYRLLSRFYGVHTPINSTAGKKEFKIIAQKLITKKNPGDFNQAVMEFGSMQCKPSSPDCNICPLNLKCIAYKDSIVASLPVKLKKQKIKQKFFNYIVLISKDGNTILEKRLNKGIWQNMYQFPLIESQVTLTKSKLLQLEAFNQLVLNTKFEIELYNKQDIIHKLSHQHLHTKFWIVRIDRLEGDHIAVSDVKNYPVPVLIGNFIDSFKF